MPSHDDSDDQRLEAPADFRGPTTEDRHCTDVLMLMLLGLSWVAMTAVGVYSVSNGDYRLVLNPMDYDGNICGATFNGVDMTNYPYLYYVNSFTGGVCVQECPDLTGVTTDGSTDMYTMITYSGIYQYNGGAQSELATDFVQVGDYSNSSFQCTDDLCYNGGPDLPASFNSNGVRRGFGFAYYVGDTYPLLYRCYLTLEAEAAMQTYVNTTNDGGLNVQEQAYDFWNRLYADLWTARWYIFGFGWGASLGISLLYIFLMRLPALLNALVWTSLLATIGVCVLGGYYAGQLAKDWDNSNVPYINDDVTVTATTAASIALYVLAGVLAVLTCCLRKQIMLAISSVKEGGKAINQMTLLLLLPVLQAAGLIAFLTVFMVYAVYLASLGTITTAEIPIDVDSALDQNGGNNQVVSYRQFEFDDTVENLGWYLLFCLFWTANFIVAIGDMIVALAVAKWYFSAEKWKVGSWTVLESVWQVLWYHAGTCAYGALVLAIVQMIRAAIAKAQQEAKRTGNKIAGCLLCCCQCCFCCLESCLKFLSKNAYIQTAIFSTPFCKSCRTSFYLIARNAARIGAVTYVSAAVLIAGKLFITALATVLGYYAIVEQIGAELNSVGGPVILIFLCSYWVTDFFLNVFDMAIATSLQCFIADAEMFGDSGYSEKSLRDWVDKHGGMEVADDGRS